MEIYKEVVDKFQELYIEIKSVKITAENINNCKIKLCDLSKDLDTIKFYISDLSATAAEASSSGQTSHNILYHTPTTATTTT